MMKSLTFSTNSTNSTNKTLRSRIRKGFSIVEVAIAMGVVTLLLTTFLGVFGPAQKNITRALSAKDANRMKDALAQEMSILRPTETYSSSFEKAFKMITNSHDKDKAILMFQYKAKPVDDDDEPDDGVLPPFKGENGIQGKDYIMQTAVRTIGVDDTKLKEELAAESVDGSVFVVKMTQLVRDPSSTATKLIISTWSEPGVTDPDNPSKSNLFTHPDLPVTNPYPRAVVSFRAEFFRLRSNNFDYVISDSWDFGKLGNPVTEVNMAVRR